MDGPTELGATREELREAREQQAATTEVLRVIGRSTGDLQPVFEAILKSATRLSGTARGGVYVRDGDVLRTVAHIGLPPGRAEYVAAHPDRITMDNGLGRAFLTREILHIDDATADPSAEDSSPLATRPRTVLIVPMPREGEPIGVIALTRGEVRPFSPSDISLVATFADQAALAIENVRLFNETKEALEQQTATSELLEVISRTTTDVAPVFEAILEDGIRLCAADAGLIFQQDGDAYRLVASRVATPGGLGLVASGIRPGRTTIGGRVALEGRTIHIRDATLPGRRA